MDWKDLRPLVREIAIEMEKRFRANDHKNGGGFDDDFSVIVKLLEEVHELANVVCDYHDPDGIVREAADVCNLAAMVASYSSGRLPSWEAQRGEGE